MKTELTVTDIARTCHEANRALCLAQDDTSQTTWDLAPDWQRESAIKGVQFNLQNPDAPPSASHESWLEEKRATGWKYGPVKDEEKKEHPCFVPHGELPPLQQAKDALFKAIVGALAPYASLARAENPSQVYGRTSSQVLPSPLS